MFIRAARGHSLGGAMCAQRLPKTENRRRAKWPKRYGKGQQLSINTRAVVLLALIMICMPLASIAQTCATQPATPQPPVVFNCIGGLCVNSGGSTAGPCPVYTEVPGTGIGTPSQFYACSVANYDANLSQLFGPLTYTGETSIFTQESYGLIENITFSWQSVGNGLYQTDIQSTAVNSCPLYWVLATPPPQAQMCSADCVGDPVNPGIGNVYLTEKDLDFANGTGAIAFKRYYSSSDATGIDGVPGWRHSYGRSIITLYQYPSSVYPGQSSTVSPQYTTPQTACTSGFAAIQSAVPSWASATASWNNQVCTISKAAVVIGTLPIQSFPVPLAPTSVGEYDLVRDDGQILRYPVQGGVVSNPPGVSIRLAVTGSGFTVTDDQDNVETYNSAGVLQSIASRSGIVQTLSYTSGVWSGVTDSFGNSLTIARNAQGSIETITANGGADVQYQYDGAMRLAVVTNLDGTTRSYVYGDSRFASALSGVVDESGTTFSTWVYNASEQATSTQEAGGAGAQTITYNSNGSVTVTDALGAVRTFTYTRIGDVNQVMSISGSQCPSCQDMASTTYDSYGWISSRTDYNGNLTCYANDPVRGLELERVEGFAPGSTCPSSLSTYAPQSGTLQRKITTVWNSTWREPSTITEPNRTTSFTYDGHGNVLTKTVTDTSVTPNVSRKWTYKYFNSGLYGQIETATGPRTDITTDVTNYTYYNCTTGGIADRLIK